MLQFDGPTDEFYRSWVQRHHGEKCNPASFNQNTIDCNGFSGWMKILWFYLGNECQCLLVPLADSCENDG